MGRRDVPHDGPRVPPGGGREDRPQQRHQQAPDGSGGGGVQGDGGPQVGAAREQAPVCGPPGGPVGAPGGGGRRHDDPGCGDPRLQPGVIRDRGAGNRPPRFAFGDKTIGGAFYHPCFITHPRLTPSGAFVKRHTRLLHNRDIVTKL